MATEYNELHACDKYIFDRLTAQAGLAALVSTPDNVMKLFSELAPREIAHVEAGPVTVVEEVEPPYVVWSFIPAEPDTLAIGRARILIRPLFFVRAVTVGPSTVEAAAIANLIDRALHNAPPAVPIAGIQVMGADRVQLMRLPPDTIDGVRYNYVGGQYKLFVHNL